MNEFTIINKYFSKLTKNNPGAFNLKDDIYFDNKKKISVTIDTYNKGVHFVDFSKPDLVIKKCLRSSISDLICKGVVPKIFFISASGGKKDFTKTNLKKIYKSLQSEQKKYSIKLSGGDTNFSRTLSFTIAFIGYSKKKPVLRKGAKLNDDIYITNTIGDSYVGLSILKKKKKIYKSKYFINCFYKPNIPFEFGKKIINFANCSIDLSDGLYQDMAHLSNSSNYFFKININKIPISKNLKNFLNRENLKPKKFISKGDDYQILFTASKKKRSFISRIAKNTRTLITRVGVVTSKKPKFVAKNEGYIHSFNQ